MDFPQWNITEMEAILPQFTAPEWFEQAVASFVYFCSWLASHENIEPALTAYCDFAIQLGIRGIVMANGLCMYYKQFLLYMIDSWLIHIMVANNVILVGIVVNFCLLKRKKPVTSIGLDPIRMCGDFYGDTSDLFGDKVGKLYNGINTIDCDDTLVHGWAVQSVPVTSGTEKVSQCTQTEGEAPPLLGQGDLGVQAPKYSVPKYKIQENEVPKYEASSKEVQECEVSVGKIPEAGVTDDVDDERYHLPLPKNVKWDISMHQMSEIQMEPEPRQLIPVLKSPGAAKNKVPRLPPALQDERYHIYHEELPGGYQRPKLLMGGTEFYDYVIPEVDLEHGPKFVGFDLCKNTYAEFHEENSTDEDNLADYGAGSKRFDYHGQFTMRTNVRENEWDLPRDILAV